MEGKDSQVRKRNEANVAERMTEILKRADQRERVIKQDERQAVLKLNRSINIM